MSILCHTRLICALNREGQHAEGHKKTRSQESCAVKRRAFTRVSKHHIGALTAAPDLHREELVAEL